MPKGNQGQMVSVGMPSVIETGLIVPMHLPTLNTKYHLCNNRHVQPHAKLVVAGHHWNFFRGCQLAHAIDMAIDYHIDITCSRFR